LVVDDDGPQRRSLKLGLELLGFSIVEAASGAEATRVLEDAPVTLALIDVWMPDETGFQLVRRLQFRHPRLPIVLTSGYPMTRNELERWTLYNVIAFVPKPYNLDELAVFLQSKLEQAATG
jgi:two-component system cell cycle sensor histidine kinase/response regulator CckA